MDEASASTFIPCFHVFGIKLSINLPLSFSILLAKFRHCSQSIGCDTFEIYLFYVVDVTPNSGWVELDCENVNNVSFVRFFLQINWLVLIDVVWYDLSFCLFSCPQLLVSVGREGYCICWHVIALDLQKVWLTKI